MQPIESNGQIFIAVIDETYDNTEDEDSYAKDSERYRIELEKEFAATFEEVNIGPAADCPAFLTFLTTPVPLWTWVFGAFFLGKKIHENMQAWLEMSAKIRSFFGKPVVLARHGAGVIAVEAIFETLKEQPKSIRLISYQPIHIGDMDDLAALGSSYKILPTPEIINLIYVWHLFEIEVDDQNFRVSVKGKLTKVVLL